jgi:hypothetical protein
VKRERSVPTAFAAGIAHRLLDDIPTDGELSAVAFSSHARTNIAVIDRPTVNLTKGNETLPTFIPKREPYALEALKQCKSVHEPKFRMLAEHPGQTVIRNTAAQVMDMMDADVCREPAKDSREVVVRAAMQRRFLKNPPVLTRPECPLLIDAARRTAILPLNLRAK